NLRKFLRKPGFLSLEIREQIGLCLFMARKKDDLFKKPGSKNWIFQASFPDVGQKMVSTGTDHKGNATSIRLRFLKTAAEAGFDAAKKELQGGNVPKGQERLAFDVFSKLYGEEFAPIG